ncbi:MAG TPA: response regulator [Opitutaceae bacterium]|nr:response regulator [Opitutaceae bacterium]
MMIDDPIILVVDDNPNDSQLMRIVFERAGFVQPLRFVPDGDAAITYLGGQGRYRNRKLHPLPTTVLMDLNMPGKNGFEVLDWIRRQPHLRRLRVYILSASSRPEDIARAYDLGANSYLVKPSTLGGLLHLAQCLMSWLKISHFAPITDAAAAVSAPVSAETSRTHLVDSAV